jgi:CHAD domain-containing protein
LERVRFCNKGWEALHRGLRRTYRQGRRACEKLCTAPETEGLHAWRRRVKDLWYDLSLLSRLPVRALPEMIQQARTLSELLGDDHDLAMLEAELAREPVRFGKGGPSVRLRLVISMERERLLKRAFRFGRRLYGPPPRVILSALHCGWRKWHA